MSLCKELIRYQDKLYLVYDKVKESHIKPEKINDLKLLWECDIVLKQKNPVGEVYLLFLNEIQEAEIIEDLVNSPQ
jgi:hypothetical protein